MVQDDDSMLIKQITQEMDNYTFDLRGLKSPNLWQVQGTNFIALIFTYLLGYLQYLRYNSIVSQVVVFVNRVPSDRSANWYPVSRPNYP